MNVLAFGLPMLLRLVFAGRLLRTLSSGNVTSVVKLVNVPGVNPICTAKSSKSLLLLNRVAITR